ncbi:hypothetical protein NEFER03_2107 [Nematocida sp. LUAm3]|nr:hypothetical protein NEFER03_2107 [Nematocida sp. LUAm3]
MRDAYIEGYQVLTKIDSGAFGIIMEGKCPVTQKKVAIKIEKKKGSKQIRQEHNMYKKLESENNYICKIYCTTQVKIYGEVRDVLIMDLLGPSLESLFNYCKRVFSLKTILMLAEMMITRVEYMHYKHLIHRDIKPDNFAFGVSEGTNGSEEICRDALYILDFGLTCFYRDAKTYAHKEIETGKKLIGTVRYASLNTHRGISQSRRDDLESIAHMLIYFAKGKLPWQSIVANTKEERYEMIFKCKETTSISTLCFGLDRVFSEFLTYCRNLEFDEMPDYLYIKKMFSSAMLRNNYVYDFCFDWYRIYNETKEPIKRNMRKKKSIEQL